MVVFFWFGRRSIVVFSVQQLVDDCQLLIWGDCQLKSKCEFMRKIECAEQVYFSKIYNRVLQIAISEKLSNANMPKSIFVFIHIQGF